MTSEDVDQDVSHFLIEKESLDFEPERTPKEKVIDKIRQIHIATEKCKQPVIDKFWNVMLSDLNMYQKHVNEPHPFQNTCYRYFSSSCIRHWDNPYWEFSTVGFRQRRYVSVYMFPIKLLSVVMMGTGGIFSMLRAHQDGKASFYANLLNVFINIIVIFIFLLGGERVLVLPKIGAILVSSVILRGIVINSTNEGVGL